MSEQTQQSEVSVLPKSEIRVGGPVQAIVPQNIEEMWRVSTIIAKSGMAPKGVDTPEKVMVCLMHGQEVGFTAMTALQSIAPINGRPTIWGDGALGLVQGSGRMEWIKEWSEGEGDSEVAHCHAKRFGDVEIKKSSFSVKDAKSAGLLGKAGPWTQYRSRMLKMRARSWALRDGFSDVLKGIGIREEVEDYAQVEAHRFDSTEAPTPVAKPPKAAVPRASEVAAEDGEFKEATANPPAQEVQSAPAPAPDAKAREADKAHPAQEAPGPAQESAKADALAPTTAGVESPAKAIRIKDSISLLAFKPNPNPKAAESEKTRYGIKTANNGLIGTFSKKAYDILLPIFEADKAAREADPTFTGTLVDMAYVAIQPGPDAGPSAKPRIDLVWLNGVLV